MKLEEHTFGAHNREMRATVMNASQSIRNEADRFLRDIDFMQETLVDCGVMPSPEHPMVALMDAIESIGKEMRKDFARITRKLIEIQALAKQVENMDDKERKVQEAQGRQPWSAEAGNGECWAACWIAAEACNRQQRQNLS